MQLRERLERELTDRAPPTAKVKVTAPTNSIERRFSVWIGEQISTRLAAAQLQHYRHGTYRAISTAMARQ